jgi:hypothetical protein
MAALTTNAVIVVMDREHSRVMRHPVVLVPASYALGEFHQNIEKLTGILSSSK